MTFALRPYQEKAIAAIESAWEDHDSVMVEMATGLGKTEIFTQLLKDCHSGSRGLVICPMLPLIHQAADKIQRRTGERPAIEQASNWSREHGWGRSDFVVGSKQSLTSKRRSGEKRFERFEDIGLLVVDECHLSITEPFAEMVNYFRAKGAKVIGLTATAKRHDNRAQGQLYDHCAFQYGIADAVQEGWLVDAKAEIVTLTSLDVSNVGTQYGPNGADFAQGQLCALLEEMETIFEIADVTARETRGLKTVVYCASVEEAKLVAERLQDHHKVNAGWICADTKRCSTQRKEDVLKSFTQDPNGITHVCNVGILTTGWDFPGLQAIVQARPTKSLPLFTQIFGRGTRPMEGVVDFEGSTPELRRQRIAESAKPFFRMIDLVDNSLEHKIVTSADVLGGKYELETVQRAKEMLADDDRKLSEVLDEAERRQKEEEAERQRIMDEMERRARERRARIQAQVEYDKRSVNLFGEREGSSRGRRQSGARMPFGKHKGKLLADMPLSYLRFAIANWEMKPWLANSIRREIEYRTNPQPVSGGGADIDEVNKLLRGF